MRRFLGAALVAVTSATALGACASQPYVIHGRAVRSDFSTLSFVGAHDGRLADEGVPNVEVYIYRDPDKLSRKLIAKGLTDGQGYLTMPVDAFGTGWMVEQWMIYTYRPGYQSASGVMSLPARKEDLRLLMLLSPGLAERPPADDELMVEYERFK